MRSGLYNILMSLVRRTSLRCLTLQANVLITVYIADSKAHGRPLQKTGYLRKRGSSCSRTSPAGSQNLPQHGRGGNTRIRWLSSAMIRTVALQRCSRMVTKPLNGSDSQSTKTTFHAPLCITFKGLNTFSLRWYILVLFV